MIAKETEFRQLVSNPAADMHGLQAEALLAEAKGLCAEFNKVYSPSVAQRLTAALAATLGAGVGTNASTSVPPPPRSALRAPTVPVETFEQKKER